MDLFFLMKILISLLSTNALAIIISKLQGKRFKLPPGPLTFPIFGSWLQIGNNLDHHILTHYANKFGDIILIRMGQLNVVTVSSKELAKQVLLTQGIEFGSRSRNIVFDIFTGKGQDMIFTEYGDHWRKMRRIVTVPFFTNKVVQQYRGDWEFEAASLVEDVRNNPKASTTGIVLRERIQLMVYNNIYKIMFDMRFESEEDPLFLKVKETNGERSRLGQNIKYNFGDFIPILRPFLNGYLKLCKELTKRRLSLYMESFVGVRKKIMSKEGKESSKGLRCAIDHFLEAQKKGEIDDHNVLYIIENMNIAAIETTVWALEWAVAELTNHPSVQTKIREEIHALLGPGVQVTESDAQKLPYLQAMIKETLRLHTIVPCLLPHMNLNDAKLGGYDIPNHSRVLVNAWRLANDPANWKEPEEFRPERFLQEESNVETNGNDMKYIPFGVGRRSCPGILIAMPVLGITLGRLVQNFELLLPPGVTKIDTRENNGQFAMRILKHSTIVLKPINN